MIHRRLLLGLYAGYLMYLFSTFFFGSTGILFYRRLMEEHSALNRNLQKIEGIGKQLQKRIYALQSDPTQIKLEARYYKLVGRNERFIRILNHELNNEPITPGSIVKTSRFTPYRPEPFLRAFSLCIAIVVFLVSGIKFTKKG